MEQEFVDKFALNVWIHDLLYQKLGLVWQVWRVSTFDQACWSSAAPDIGTSKLGT
jgi:hypothetical protein